MFTISNMPMPRKYKKTLSEIAQESNKANKGTESKNKKANLPETAKRKSIGAAFGEEVVIRADKNTNSLIITANKTDYEKVLSILKKIDIPRDQVFVESVIMEIDVEKSREVGLSVFNLVPSSPNSSGVSSIVARQGFCGFRRSSQPNGQPSSQPRRRRNFHLWSR